MDAPAPERKPNPLTLALCASVALHAAALLAPRHAPAPQAKPPSRIVLSLAPAPQIEKAPAPAERSLALSVRARSESAHKPSMPRPALAPEPKKALPARPAPIPKKPASAKASEEPAPDRYERTREVLARSDALRSACEAEASAEGRNPGTLCDEVAGLARDEGFAGAALGSALGSIAAGEAPAAVLRKAWAADGARIVYLVDGKMVSGWRQTDDPRNPHDNSAEIIAGKFDLAAIWEKAGPEPKGSVETVDLPSLSVKDRMEGLDRSRSYAHLRSRYSYVALRSGGAVAVAFMPADRNPAGLVSRPLSEADFEILSKLPHPSTGAVASRR